MMWLYLALYVGFWVVWGTCRWGSAAGETIGWWCADLGVAVGESFRRLFASPCRICGLNHPALSLEITRGPRKAPR